MTDYTGVPLKDILYNFEKRISFSLKTISNLQKYEIQVKNNDKLIENSNCVLDFIGHFIDVFSRYNNDIRTLIHELPNGMRESHIEILNQLYESSISEEKYTISFKGDWVHKPLPHEEMRPLLDRIYSETRGLVGDYSDLPNIVRRIKTYRRSDEDSKGTGKYILFKPNLYGVELNATNILGWIKRKYSAYKNR